MCVASTSSQDLIELCLRSQGIADLFEFCLSSEVVGPGKGEPDLYLEAVRRLGGKPETAAVFEDALYAMQTAKKAGFYVVGIHDRAEAVNWSAITQLADETMYFE